MEDKEFFCNTFEFKLQNLNKKANNCSFSGYASVFNVVDYQNDIISEKAFDISKDRTIPLLWQHDCGNPIGKIIEIRQDTNGLYIVASLCMAIQKAQEIFVLLKEGIISGMSIGYSVVDCEVEKHCNKTVRRIIKACLWEISLVTFPANCRARITNVTSNNNNLEVLEQIHMVEDTRQKAYMKELINEEEVLADLLNYVN